MPVWLLFALAAVFCWGFWGFFSKLAVDQGLHAWHVALFQGVGIMLVTLPLLWTLRTHPIPVGWPVVAGIGGGVALMVGIVLFSQALGIGGKASVVVPLTALYPLVTVVLSLLLLREGLNVTQTLGIGFAIVATVLLSR